MKLALLYGWLAAIAIAINILSQEIAVLLYRGPLAIPVSVLAGTGVGLLVKYLLDKRYIFRYSTRHAAHDAQLFVLYSLMGVATTAIFWGFEFGFQWLFGNRPMRYLGGVLGLALGYWIKYHLDRRFVFRAA